VTKPAAKKTNSLKIRGMLGKVDNDGFGSLGMAKAVQAPVRGIDSVYLDRWRTTMRSGGAIGKSSVRFNFTR
jgi:hypothetical protein